MYRSDGVVDPLLINKKIDVGFLNSFSPEQWNLSGSNTEGGDFRSQYERE